MLLAMDNISKSLNKKNMKKNISKSLNTNKCAFMKHDRKKLKIHYAMNISTIT